MSEYDEQIAKLKAERDLRHHFMLRNQQNKKKAKKKAKQAAARKKPKSKRKWKPKAGKKAKPSVYAKYIKSAEWRAKSKQWREETGKCEKCGSTHQLACHHLHYDTLGNEKREDIEILCYKCHCEAHGVTKFKRK